jgi:hypothetical protein
MKQGIIRRFLEYKRLPYILFAIICVFFVIQMFRYIHVNLDDKFILYKYATNLAEGKGLVFNTGEKVEGFSSFLYVIILAGIFKLFNVTGSSITAVSGMSIIGRIIPTLASFGTLCYLFQFSRKILRFTPIISFISLALLLLRIDFVYSATNGLETGLFIFFYTACVYHVLYHYCDKKRDTDKHLAIAAIYAAVLIITRVDGFLFIAVLFTTVLAWRYLKDKQTLYKTTREMVILLIPTLGTLILFMVFRLIYFGDLYPNTYYVKIAGLFEMVFPGSEWNKSADLVPAWHRFHLSFLNYVIPAVWVAAAVSIFLIIIYFISGKATTRSNQSKWGDYCNLMKGPADSTGLNYISILSIVSIVTAVLSLYVVYTGGDWMPCYRYIMHYYPVFHVVVTALFLHFLIYIYKNFATRHFETYLPAALFITTLLISYYQIDTDSNTFLANLYHIANDKNIGYDHSYYVFEPNEPLRNHLTLYSGFVEKVKEKVPAGETIAFYEGGMSLLLGDDYKLIDISGLNNRFMALNRSHNALRSFCVNLLYFNCGKTETVHDRYIVEQNPRYIIFDSVYFLCFDKKIETIDRNNSDQTIPRLFQQYYPEYILDRKYRKVQSFPYNSLKFFLIYERVGL